MKFINHPYRVPPTKIPKAKMTYWQRIKDAAEDSINWADRKRGSLMCLPIACAIAGMFIGAGKSMKRLEAYRNSPGFPAISAAEAMDRKLEDASNMLSFKMSDDLFGTDWTQTRRNCLSAGAATRSRLDLLRDDNLSTSVGPKLEHARLLLREEVVEKVCNGYLGSTVGVFSEQYSAIQDIRSELIPVDPGGHDLFVKILDEREKIKGFAIGGAMALFMGAFMGSILVISYNHDRRRRKEQESSA